MNTSTFPSGYKGHLAQAAKRWLKAREIEQTFSTKNDLDGLEIVAESLQKVEEEFFRAARLATESGAVWSNAYNLDERK